jgi:hypothetical protein
MRSKLALRDLSILGVTLLLWQLDASLRSGGSTSVAMSVGVAAGVLTAVCGYFFHEWGHLAGAAWVKAVVHHPSTLAAVFLFQFDSDRNDRRQFLGMSFGGFAASAIAVTALLAWLPTDALAGRLALTLTLLGVVATVVLEFPPAWRVARGAPIPTGAAYRSSDEDRAGA